MRTMLRSRNMSSSNNRRCAKPYCRCWSKFRPKPWEPIVGCACGEEHSNICEWRWELPDSPDNSWVVMCPNQRQVTFYPHGSSGTAAVRGDTPLVHNYHYYWEVKMLTMTYGIDIMIGLGTNQVDMTDCLSTYAPFLGRNNQSYGLSYTGALQHGAIVCRDDTGFCKGSIIGVKVDLWQGTLEFYVNRKSKGISFYNLRRHSALYPMICSSVAQSSMRLIYASSWKASLLVDAAKILAASVNSDKALELPPGLRSMLNNQFWMMLPSQRSILDEIVIQQPTRKLSESSSSMSPGPKRKRYFL